MTYTVHSRYGWGWQVQGPKGQSFPIEESIAAEIVSQAMNDGAAWETAYKKANLELRDGRAYLKS